MLNDVDPGPEAARGQPAEQPASFPPGPGQPVAGGGRRRTASAMVNPADPDFDEKALIAMGYEQELFRGFSSLMNFSFCFTAVGVIGSISGLFPTAMWTGGPVVLTWAWIGCGMITIIIGACLGEICSVYPFAGSVYHWTGCMAPRNWAPALSFVCGWFNFLGNAAGDAFFANAFVTNVANLAANNGYEMTLNGQVGFMCGVVVSWGIINFLRIDRQGWVNNISTLYQIVVTIVIIISVFVGCGKQGLLASGSDIFTQYNDETGFGNTAYVVLIGLLTPMYAVTGYEAAGHMSEETHHAHKSSPVGIFMTCVVAVVLGFIYVMALVAPSAVDFPNVFDNNITSTTGVFLWCNGFDTGQGLGGALAVMIYLNGISSLTVTTRITFAMARDSAFPGSTFFRFLTPNTKSPVGAILLVMIVDIVMLLLNLGSTSAFTAITSIAVIGYQMSYFIPIFIRITWMRNTFPLDAPFSLGRFSVPLGCLGSFWLLFTSILFVFPTSYPIEAETMNWTLVVFAGFFFIALVYWVVAARFFFQGPKRLDVFTDSTGHSMVKSEELATAENEDFHVGEFIKSCFNFKATPSQP